MKDQIIYYFIRIFTYPLSFFPIKTIHLLGKIIGSLAFYIMPEYRKTALSNLALSNLNLKKKNKNIKKIARKSFQNLAINILEFLKLSKMKNENLKNFITCKNPQKAQKLYKNKKGIIFFCGHQANWDLLFIDGNLRMKGVAIARPIENKKLYKWLLSIREKTNGKIVNKKNGIKEGLKALREGKFLGIVTDQGMPSSNYSFDFLGRKAYFSNISALLSYKTNSPIIVATIKRKNYKYFIDYSDPIFPNNKNSKEKEVKYLMDKSFKLLEESIKKNPDQWLWQHNMWKKQTPTKIYKKFRRDSIAIILPKEKKLFYQIIKALPTIKDLYKEEFVSLYIPSIYKNIKLPIDEIVEYKNFKKMAKDYKFKLVYNFSKNRKIKRHFAAAIDVITLLELKKRAKRKNQDLSNQDLSKIFKDAICR